MQRQVLISAGAGATSGPITMLSDDNKITVDGTFSGQTVTIDAQTPDGNWVQVVNSEFTESAHKLLRLNKGSVIRFNVSNGGSPSINAWIDDRNG